MTSNCPISVLDPGLLISSIPETYLISVSAHSYDDLGAFPGVDSANEVFVL